MFIFDFVNITQHMYIRILTLIICHFVAVGTISTQSLPAQWRIDEQNHIIKAGDQESKKLYNESNIEEVRLYFSQSNFLTLLASNYASKKDLLCKMVYKGVTYDSIGVRYKGQTSYFMNQTQKKSFAVSLDAFKEGQDIDGYNNLNLDNSWTDPSMMREVLYYNLIRNHTPAAKANFVIVYLNDVSWGVYQNVEQLNKDFLKEWYPNPDGTNLRADVPPGTSVGGGPGGGAQWGDGTAAINYLGEDTTLYKKYYTLKSTDETDPWVALKDASKVLKNSTNLAADAPKYFDIDKILWHLAAEIAFGDDDSYVYKGKMDYYVYHEPTLGRWATYDYDANSTFVPAHSTWSPFYNANKANYPLLNKLLAVPSFRQRYLAHLRTIIDQSFDQASFNILVDTMDRRIKNHVFVDTKKASTNAQYTSELTVLRKFVTDRRTYLLSNAEVKMVAPTIASVQLMSYGQPWSIVREGDQTTIVAKASHSAGIKECALHLGSGIISTYERLLMYDDGTHGDVVASDGEYAITIDNPLAGALVTFYVEAVANNTDKTISFYPQGTEHELFYYNVQAKTQSAATVVINEFMASNKGIIKDENGEDEDWIELFNTTNSPVNLSGYVMTDDDANLDKFVFAEGTILPAGGYLIVWADEDGVQGPLHANFRLAAGGEKIILLNKEKVEIDRVEFGVQETDLSSARKPNGTGSFKIGSHTFGFNNDTSPTNDEILTNLVIQPNPALTEIQIVTDKEISHITIYDMQGRALINTKNTTIDVQNLLSGTYVIKADRYVGRFVKL